MSIQIIQNDITLMNVEAIVNPTDRYYTGLGGTDGAIHRAAGAELRNVCNLMESCPVGEARVTPGFHLKAKYVIHTVGPIWQGGECGESDQLRSCYINSLKLAVKHRITSVAFPLLASGTFGYPKAEAIQTAMSAIRDFLMDHEMIVYLVVYDKEALRVSEEQYGEVKSYIDRNTANSERVHRARNDERALSRSRMSGPILSSYNASIGIPEETEEPIGAFEADYGLLSKESDSAAERQSGLLWDNELEFGTSLEDMLNKKDKSFAEALLDMIDARGVTDAYCYKKANVDKAVFNKIKNKKGYKPQKSTVVALAFALEPTREELVDLLARAGFALSNNNDFDIIIQYYLSKSRFDVMEVNVTLFQFNQPLLGSFPKDKSA